MTHERLDEALAGLAATDVAAADASPALAVRDLVHEHLSHEEPILFPALRAHVTEAQWTAFTRHTVDTAPATGRHLFVGFLERVGSADEVELLLRHLPPPARDALPGVRLRAREVFAAPAADRRHPGGATP